MTHHDNEPSRIKGGAAAGSTEPEAASSHLQLVKPDSATESVVGDSHPRPKEQDRDDRSSMIIKIYGSRPSNLPLGIALVAALVIHGAIGTATHSMAVPKRMEERVKMEMYKPPPPPPPPEPEPKKEEPKEEKKKPKKKKPKKKKAEPPPPSNQEPPPEPAKKPPPIVPGISMKSTTKGKSGFKVRVGNTAYGDPNKEKFVSADQVKGYGGGSREFKPVRTAQVSRQAKPIRRFKPRYPRALVDEGIEGRVLLKVEVTRTGKVRNVKVLKRLHPLLDKLSIKAVRKTKFRPAQVNGKNVDSKVNYTVKWELTD